MKERLDGIKYDLQQEDLETLEDARQHLITRHQQLTVEIERLDQAILARTQPELEFQAE